MQKLYIVIFLLIPINAWCQEQEKHPLKQGELNRVLNNAFNRLVTSNPSSGEIANYVTLDPINASFTAKSTIPLTFENKKKTASLTREEKLGLDEGNISYLSFSVSGSLIDKNYGVLFSNSSLNSGISLAAQYNVSIGKPTFAYDRSAWQAISMKREQLVKKYRVSQNALVKSMSKGAIVSNKYLLELELSASREKLETKQTKRDMIQKSIDSLGAGIKQRTGLGDSLRTTVKEIIDLEQAISASEIAIDSIGLLLANDVNGQRDIARDNLFEKLKKDYDTLFTTASLLKIQTTWFTLIGGYSRNAYTTFDSSLPFANQFSQGKLDGFNFGIAVNYLHQDRLRLRTLFLNGSISRNRTTNLALLTAKTVEDVQQFTGSSGSPTRTTTTTYTAYTDPVIASMAWNLSAHGYFLFGKTPSGVHVFPSINVQDNHQTITNLTLGYLIAFRNTVSDQPIINSELYIRFNDLSDEGRSGNRFFKRNEIGLSFTVPFAIF